MNTYKEIALLNSGVFNDSIFDSTTCTCSNMLLEAHYTVYYSDFNNSYGVQSQINNITVDVIYGDYIPATCATNV